jgi:hypothetical protein
MCAAMVGGKYSGFVEYAPFAFDLDYFLPAPLSSDTPAPVPAPVPAPAPLRAPVLAHTDIAADDDENTAAENGVASPFVDTAPLHPSASVEVGAKKQTSTQSEEEQLSAPPSGPSEDQNKAVLLQQTQTQIQHLELKEKAWQAGSTPEAQPREQGMDRAVQEPTSKSSKVVEKGGLATAINCFSTPSTSVKADKNAGIHDNSSNVEFDVISMRTSGH